ncbi:fimbrial protein [Achromobacter pestifer]|uniref:PAP fimbrial minor pilin protein n=1 Tax=Achromobacter pestifer TaxID=1353889 RepID=A0A6S6YTJ5_9BURK|nr:fimbrial protein [Achromobacter pestifer]CAB3640027.1 PAP fimbrial minor pilin protein [Achromobacter pestifer]
MHRFKTASRSGLLLLLIAHVTGAVDPANAQALEGKVNMSGAIVNGACSIQVETKDQTISMVPAPISGLVSGEATIQQPFTLQLVNCSPGSNSTSVTTGSNAFTLIFEGAGDSQMFLARGSAKGIAIRIKDSRGNPVMPGVPMHELLPSSGDLALNYALRLTGTGAALQAGDYQITIRLRMNYF